MKVDLHIHTNVSDGLLSPVEIVSKASEIGLEVIAITDHDAIDGITIAQSKGLEQGVEVISGLQLTVQWEGKNFETLCYHFDLNNIALADVLKTHRSQRTYALKGMIDKLARLGMSIDYERVMSTTNSTSIGRPHIAQAMLEAGYVKDIKEAFEKYLGEGKPAYEKRQVISLDRAVEIVHSCGGVIILAHPIIIGVPEYLDYKTIIPVAAKVGIDGIEAYYLGYPQQTVDELCALADTHNLICTGGSDFHGGGIALDSQLGKSYVPVDCVHQLKERAARYVG